MHYYKFFPSYNQYDAHNFRYACLKIIAQFFGKSYAFEGVSMKHFLFFILFSGICFIPKAQTITGKVIDAKNNSVEFANVVLLSLPDSTFIQGTITEMDGTFRITSTQPVDDLFLRISAIGYVTVHKPCNSADAGTIVLSEDVKLLDDVVVKGSLPATQLKGDGMVTTIENSVLAKAGTAEDVLGKIPGVIKERDTYEVLGKGAPVIYINGREVRDNSELDLLNSGDIKSVELITNPGSKYDASVKAGIRIQTIRRTGDGFGFDLRSSYYQSENTDLVEQVNMNYRHNNLDLFGTFRFDRTRNLQKATIEQQVFADVLWTQNNTMKDEGTKRNYQEVLGFNYYINDNHNFGARYTLTETPENSWHTVIESEVLADGSFYDNWYSESMEASTTHPTHRLNAYYNGKAGNLEIDFNTDYYSADSKTKSYTFEESQEQDNREINSVNNVDNELFATKLTMSYPLWEGNCSWGGEYTRTDRNDDYVNEENYVATTYSHIKENNIRAFVEYTRSLEFGRVAAGLRYEHIGFDYYENEIHSDDQSRNFSNWYPNVSFGTEIGRLRMQLSYTAKTKRPTYRQLSNNVLYLSRFSLSKGDPSLKSSTIHDVTLNGTWKFLQMMISYQQERDAIIYWGSQLETNEAVTVITFRNEDKLPSFAASISAAPKIGFWSPMASIGVRKYWATIESELGSFKFNDPRVTGVFNNAFRLSETTLVNLDFNYRGKGDNQNIHLSRRMYLLNASFLQSFMKDALSIELRGSDLLHSRKDHNLTTFDQSTLFQANQYDSREFSVTLRYKFNTAKSKYKGTEAGQSEINRM